MASGITFLLELYECPPTVLNDDALIDATVRGAVEHANATLVHQVSRRFTPQGVTALAVLAESHMSIHTWPEFGYAAVDIFTCGSRAMPERACEYLVRAFGAARHTITRVDRGTDLNIKNARFGPKALAAAAPIEAS